MCRSPKIDLSLNNIDESVFRFGVIARSLIVFETGSFSYPGRGHRAARTTRRASVSRRP